MPDDPIDATTFADLLETVGGDREFLAELVETYLADSPSLFAELRAAVAADDAASARRAAHTLKSTSASFGAQRLSGMCREIEAAAAAGNLVGLDESVELAATEYARVEVELRRRASADEVT
jgi:HPt (histidine-containing phosphotransfer) domain-containing protein